MLRTEDRNGFTRLLAIEITGLEKAFLIPLQASPAPDTTPLTPLTTPRNAVWSRPKTFLITQSIGVENARLRPSQPDVMPVIAPSMIPLPQVVTVVQTLSNVERSPLFQPRDQSSAIAYVTLDGDLIPKSSLAFWIIPLTQASTASPASSLPTPFANPELKSPPVLWPVMNAGMGPLPVSGLPGATPTCPAAARARSAKVSARTPSVNPPIVLVTTGQSTSSTMVWTRRSRAGITSFFSPWPNSLNLDANFGSPISRNSDPPSDLITLPMVFSAEIPPSSNLDQDSWFSFFPNQVVIPVSVLNTEFSRKSPDFLLLRPIESSAPIPARMMSPHFLATRYPSVKNSLSDFCPFLLVAHLPSRSRFVARSSDI